MHLPEFIAKWTHSTLTERSAAQSWFLDLCRVLDVDAPTDVDPEGTFYTFERGATKTSGKDGWADVWKKGCFAWEFKGKHANLTKAYEQLARYSAALENPPVLVVSDFDDSQRTLTNLYNQRPTWLLNMHAALDRAVWDAYGWPEDEVPAEVAEEVILERVLGLNGERAKT